MDTAEREPHPNRLRIVRADKRKTQLFIELETGISQPKVSLIERGVLRGTDDERQKIAAALESTIDEVFPAEQVNA